MSKLIAGLIKSCIFCGFLIALVGFSGVTTIKYLSATGTVEVPDLIGKDEIYAADLLAERHLDLKAVDRQFHAKIPKDRILSQDPPSGAKIQKNRAVRIILSKGAEAAIIPDVTGKRWQEALNTLQQNKFRPGNVAYVHSAEVPVDSVIAQTPPPHSEASSGGKIDLLVSLGTYKTVMVMPDLVEEQLAYARQVIRKLGLVLGKVAHEEYDVAPGTVLSQVPKPGTLVEEQNIVTLVVSGNPRGTEVKTPVPKEQMQSVSLEYMVPPGRFDREVMVIVRNAEGESEMYRQFAPPGNRIVVQIPVVGETVAEIYLDGVLDNVTRFGSQGAEDEIEDNMPDPEESVEPSDF